MRTLMLGNPESDKPRLTFCEFMASFRLEDRDRVEQRVRRMRESHQGKDSVATREEFQDEVRRFFLHADRCFYPSAASVIELPSWSEAIRLMEVLVPQRKHWDAEDDALYGYNRGLIGLIDDLTEAMVQQRIDWYFKDKFRGYLPDSNWDPVCELIAAAVVQTYGHLLPTTGIFRHSAAFTAVMLASRLPDVIKGIVLVQWQLQRTWHA